MTCVVSNAPSGCSIQGPGTGTNNVAITLTAFCASGSPTTYAWSGGNCAGVATQSCQAKDSNNTVNYSVVISNAIGPGSPNPATKSVVWSASLPVPPSNCSITPTPASLPAGGGAVSLTAQCSGDPVDTWTWSNATYTTTAGNTATASITSTTTFKVQATNGGGSSNGQVQVSVGGGGGGGPQFCSGFLSTSNQTLAYPFNNNTGLAMGSLDAAVLTFTTNSNTGTGVLRVFSSGVGNPPNHDFTLSDTPCDFGAGRKQVSGAQQFTVNFNVTTGGGIKSTLQTNHTYYINIKNSQDGFGCAATGASCNLSPIFVQGP